MQGADFLILLVLVQSICWISWGRAWTLRSAFMWGVLIQFVTPYTIVCALDKWCGVQLIRRGATAFEYTIQDLTWCLLAANIALACIGLGYLANRKWVTAFAAARTYERDPKRRQGDFVQVAILWFVAVLTWALAIGLAHGISAHFADPLARRGGADPGSAGGFLIPLAMIMVLATSTVLVGYVTLAWHQPGCTGRAIVAALGLTSSLGMLLGAGGRGAVITYAGVVGVTIVKCLGRSIGIGGLSVMGAFAVSFAVFGHTVFDINAWSEGIGSVLWSDIVSSGDQLEWRLQKLVTFGQSVVHPILIRDYLDSGGSLHHFRDVPEQGLYLLPKAVHGVQYYTVQEEMMDLFPDPGANNNVKIVTYLLWGGGWTGVVIGGLLLGALLGFVDRWASGYQRSLAFYGAEVMFVFSAGVGLFNGGPASLRDLIPSLSVLVFADLVLNKGEGRDRSALKRSKLDERLEQPKRSREVSV